MTPSAAPLTLPPAQYRAHTSTGRIEPTHTEGAARRRAENWARWDGAPVAIERWDFTRQEWVLVDLAPGAK